MVDDSRPKRGGDLLEQCQQFSHRRLLSRLPLRRVVLLLDAARLSASICLSVSSAWRKSARVNGPVSTSWAINVWRLPPKRLSSSPNSVRTAASCVTIGSKICALPILSTRRTAPFSSSLEMIVWIVVYAGRFSCGNRSSSSRTDALPKAQSALITCNSNFVNLTVEPFAIFRSSQTKSINPVELTLLHLSERGQEHVEPIIKNRISVMGCCFTKTATRPHNSHVPTEAR